jgi:Glycosyltransferase like family
MIAFGSAVTSPEDYERYAEPGIQRAREPDSLVLAHPSAGSIHRNYNAIMERATAIEGLEALVLLHQDAEIVDARFCEKLRAALRDPDVGVVGCVGALGVRSIAWWEGSVTWASFIHRYSEFGGGDSPSVTWDENASAPYARLGEVDTVDGFVLGLSPWVVHNVRFDESLGQALHGYDFDFCLQVRAARRKVVTADFKVIHNHSLNLASDLGHWSEAHMAVSEKWDGKIASVGFAGGDWRHRARRAEAEAAVTRAAAMSTRMRQAAHTARHERVMAEMTESLSWRLTAPLRRLKAFQRNRREPSSEAAEPLPEQSVLGRRIG